MGMSTNKKVLILFALMVDIVSKRREDADNSMFVTFESMKKDHLSLELN